MKQKLINCEFCQRCKKTTESVKQGRTIFNLRLICFECGIVKYQERNGHG